MTVDPASPKRGFRFQSLKGYFIAQESMEGDVENTAQKITQKDLGLLPRTYLEEVTSSEHDGSKASWPAFAEHVKELNKNAPDGVSYKVVFVTRHGQGHHNVQEAKVGTKEWEGHWALLDGDGTVTWADADLTEKGQQQAVETGRIWAELIQEREMPFPVLYCSPLQRCLKTSRIIYQDLSAKRGRLYRPIVKELLREQMGRHTCDRRSPRSWIQANFPECVFEDGFTEADELFRSDVRETDDEGIAREHVVLEDIFAHEPADFIALTMHSAASRFLMEAIGHEVVRLAPAASIVFLIKGENVTE
ncbi:hypothetical protein PFICI_09286 [Pestalotiopsis fici W106-1]|uniref:Phosphoglycerate mutase n=1 Tax=Pestalotiopsis fici (strain W106-1 / CGMCC3.15140) TaxID=1229662 RepID=W3WZX4_PESFW|nr:uncharacterized protein PFICI_09286 [Pestalotiopsis fici W106-1]ETS79433.1 hypothetical protein PFICI_09286 [Pestalotiopsis fici W106-1]